MAKIKSNLKVQQRGRDKERRAEKKAAIRDAFANGPQKEVQIIPATHGADAETETRRLRVCAYCRVSTEEENQATSYELQVQNYTEMIQSNEEWEFAGIYADEGISGTSTLHREHFLEIIEHCKEAGPCSATRSLKMVTGPLLRKKLRLYAASIAYTSRVTHPAKLQTFSPKTVSQPSNSGKNGAVVQS